MPRMRSSKRLPDFGEHRLRGSVAMMWKRIVATFPGVGVALLPKLTCPMCWPAYAGLLTTLGLGFLISERYLFRITAAFLLVSVGALAFGARGRRGYGPAGLG